MDPPARASGGKSSSSTSPGVDQQASQLYQQMGNFPPFFPPFWGGMNAQAYYGMMMGNPMLGQQGEGKGGCPDASVLQMMMAMQGQSQSSGSSAVPGCGDPGGCGGCCGGADPMSIGAAVRDVAEERGPHEPG